MMKRLRARRAALRRNENSGFTLIELLVAMSIFAVLLAVMMSVIVSMNSDMVKTQGVGDSAQRGLQASEALDKELRYADWINTPAYGVSNTTDRYISFESLNGTDNEMCYQWRLHTGGLLQQRSWVSANSTSVTTTSPAWTTVAIGVVNSATVMPFTVTNNSTQVLVDLVLQSTARPVGHAETKLLITARNVASGPGSLKCNVTNT
jgi:prepilin-type N-terminal cleavage/methylation domain-containing protein